MAGKTMIILSFLMIFLFGWFCSSVYSNVLSHVEIGTGPAENLEAADSADSILDRYFFKGRELISPHDWISEDQIHVYSNRVVIDIDSPQWAVFTDTNSMDPVIDAGAHAIEVVPELPDDIHMGDIVSYKSDYADGILIHRVVEIGNDGEWYCRMKGDNNPFEDPGKIRFDQLQRVLVAVIY